MWAALPETSELPSRARRTAAKAGLTECASRSDLHWWTQMHSDVRECEVTGEMMIMDGHAWVPSTSRIHCRSVTEIHSRPAGCRTARSALVAYTVQTLNRAIPGRRTAEILAEYQVDSGLRFPPSRITLQRADNQARAEHEALVFLPFVTTDRRCCVSRWKTGLSPSAARRAA